jgi:hypothetical protein
MCTVVQVSNSIDGQMNLSPCLSKFHQEPYDVKHILILHMWHHIVHCTLRGLYCQPAGLI